MQTAILSADNSRGIVITQQYEIGLYVAFYSATEDWETVGLPRQIGMDKKEVTFHKKLRKDAEKRGATIITEHSTPIN